MGVPLLKVPGISFDLVILNGFWKCQDLDSRKGEVVGYDWNRLRRFMPTLGNVMQLDPMAMQAIGSWTEVPQGGGLEPTAQKSRATVPMGLHYASQKVARSAGVKMRCITRFLQLYHHKVSDFSLGSDGLLFTAWKFNSKSP